jgi:hypothetical protein
MSSLFADQETIAGLYRYDPFSVSHSVQPLFSSRMLKSQARCQRELSLPTTTMSRRWADQDVTAGFAMEMPPMFSHFFSQLESENWDVSVGIDRMGTVEADAHCLVEDLVFRAYAENVDPVWSLAQTMHQRSFHPPSSTIFLSLPKNQRPPDYQTSVPQAHSNPRPNHLHSKSCKAVYLFVHQYQKPRGDLGPKRRATEKDS